MRLSVFADKYRRFVSCTSGSTQNIRTALHRENICVGLVTFGMRRQSHKSTSHSRRFWGVRTRRRAYGAQNVGGTSGLSGVPGFFARGVTSDAMI